MSLRSERLVLLSNASSTGAAVTAELGGRYVFAVEGTFGGGTVQLQAAGPNGTQINIDGAALTANGFVAVDVAAGSSLRATVTGGTPSALFATLVRVPE